MKKKINLKIERLTSNESTKLIGGFSFAFSGLPQDSTLKVNNCNGGNLKAGCGKTSNKKNNSVGSNTNCKGNCVKGCGDKH